MNGEDVTNDHQEDVVAKIKALPNEVHLLVADAVTYEQFKRSDDHFKSEMELFIEIIACPDDALEPGTGVTDLITVISASSSLSWSTPLLLNHKQRSSDCTVLTASGLVNGEGEILTPYSCY